MAATCAYRYRLGGFYIFCEYEYALPAWLPCWLVSEELQRTLPYSYGYEEVFDGFNISNLNDEVYVYVYINAIGVLSRGRTGPGHHAGLETREEASYDRTTASDATRARIHCIT